jgi:hypothetical protein
MVGKITDEDMLAASASGNANTLNFAAFKNMSNHLQQQHQNSNNQNYNHKNHGNPFGGKLNRQDSNSK